MTSCLIRWARTSNQPTLSWNFDFQSRSCRCCVSGGSGQMLLSRPTARQSATLPPAQPLLRPTLWRRPGGSTMAAILTVVACTATYPPRSLVGRLPSKIRFPVLCGSSGVLSKPVGGEVRLVIPMLTTHAVCAERWSTSRCRVRSPISSASVIVTSVCNFPVPSRHFVVARYCVHCRAPR